MLRKKIGGIVIAAAMASVLALGACGGSSSSAASTADTNAESVQTTAPAASETTK